MNDEIKMPNFLVDLSMYECIEDLDNETAGQVFKLLFKYASDEKVDEKSLSPFLRYAFKSFKPCIDENREKYIAKVLRNRKNGKNRSRTSNNPVEPTGTQNNPVETNKNKENKTKVKETKLNKVSNKDTLFSDSTEVSIVGMPEGQPTQKPEYSELRQYFKSIAGYDDAYMCDDFERAIKKYGNDWADWQNKFYRFAVKQGVIRDGTTV